MNNKLPKKLYMSIGKENEYLTTPFYDIKKGRRKVPWNRLDSSTQAFYTEVVGSVMLIIEEE